MSEGIGPEATQPHQPIIRYAHAGAPPYYASPPPPPRKAKASGSRKNLMGCLLGVGMALVLSTCVCLIAGAIIVNNLQARLEEGIARLETIREREVFESSRIYDRHGLLLYEVFEEGRRTSIPLERIPERMIQATIAIEDDTFYENIGVDVPSIMRAAWQWLTTGKVVSGGSTITQQLVRHIAFDYEYRTERSIRRKLDEALLAIMLTNMLSKDEILEFYLNEIYYGNLAYGIEAAAEVYFGKSAEDLTLAEAALLAGLPQAPAELDPLSGEPEAIAATRERQRLVLDRMVDEGFITQEQADAAFAQDLVLARPEVSMEAPHFTVYAQEELEIILNTLGLDPTLINNGGLEVYTSLDLRYQRLAEQIVADQVNAMRDAHNMHNAAAVVIRVATGEILAMVGSVDYWDDDIDGRVNMITSPRQPGSAIKPLTYAAALELGWTPGDVLWDTETHIPSGADVYIPVDYDNRFHGPVRMRYALANSYNIPAVQMLRWVGVNYLLSMAARFGIASLGADPSRYGLSLTLGGGELTPLELTQAYTVFANGGYLVRAVSILCVIDRDGNILYQYENRCPHGTQTPGTVNSVADPRPVIDPRIAFIISDILADNDARTPAMGANSPLNTGDLPTSVKTGTTNDFRDNWTVGYTGNVAIGVWAGNTDNTPMQDVSGLAGAAPIWHEIITGIYADSDLLAVLADDGVLRPDWRVPPTGVSQRVLCVLSSLSDPTSNCPRTRLEWFLDTPATYPDTNGNWVIAPGRHSTPIPTGNDPDSPMVAQVEPGLWQATVIPLPESLGRTTIVRSSTPGIPEPPPPRYCIVTRRYEGVPGLQNLLFIEPPPVADDAIFARLYARDHDIPILPPITCDAAMMTTLLGERDGLDAVWYISDPAPGDQVGGVVPIIGTANFRTDQVQFYKLEIGRGEAPQEWVTLGDLHYEPVIDDVLEWLHADALDPGPYVLRLVLVKIDSNTATPYEVPITIVR